MPVVPGRWNGIEEQPLRGGHTFDVDRVVLLQNGVDPVEAIEEGLSRGLNSVGDMFGKGELFLTGLLMAAEASSAAMSILVKKIPEGKVAGKGKVVIGTVEGDVHFIGKNLVSMMLEASGFEVYDIGEDQPVESFIEKAKEVNADIIGASALITSTRVQQEKISQALRRSGLTTRYMVGGAVVDAAWTERIGADGNANNLVEAVELAKRLVDGK